ncbi:4-trimethylaminobutyraldehyde dehydrogenase [Chamberlinius hualienensis]
MSGSSLCSIVNCRLLVRSISSWTSAVKGSLNYIDNERTRPLQPERYKDVFEPANGRRLCSLPISTSDDINNAVIAARQASHLWSRTDAAERAKILWKAAEITRANLNGIAELEVKDCGKPLWEAKADISACADALQFFAGLSQTSGNVGEQRNLSNGAFYYSRREPLGVCVGIGAWNFPFLIATWKTAAALATGNTVVYKPSEVTPLSAVTLGEILAESGLPKSCYNVIQGDGLVGEELCRHPAVAKVSFTGSVLTGSKVMAACASTIKRVTLELGGKSPLVVFDDFDVDEAVRIAISANFLSQGQVCSNATRIYVHKKIYEIFLKKFVEAVKKLKVGDPMAQDSDIGATISQTHAQKIINMLKTAKEQGAVLEFGGEQLNVMDGGAYLSPCILSNVDDSAEIVREEVFGAVACVMKFATEVEVIQRANNTHFGLAGGVLTDDISRAHRVAAELQCGNVWINNYNVYPPELPFGGYKMSGFGRENGLAVIDSYTQLKAVYVHINK